MGSNIKIAIIITNYNGLKYLAVYLENVKAACNQNNIALYITDNGSTDGSIEYLKNGGYNYTVNPEAEKGYASNLNNGIRYALQIQNYDYLILSNNDIRINGRMFGPLMRTLQYLRETDPAHGLIGFTEVLPGKEDQYELFDFVSFEVESVKKVNEMIGFFFFGIAVNVIEKIGFFDEDYFIYGEDNDYSFRVQNAGFHFYQTNLPVMHFSEGSSSNSKLTSWYVYRNAFLFAQKNLGFKKCMLMLFSFFNQIYNPFYKEKTPSNSRVRRNGFLYNNYLLIKSLLWNLGYYLKKNK